MANTVSSNLLTTAQAADRLGITLQHFYALCLYGNGPAVAARSGRRNLYRAEDVDAWYTNRQRVSASLERGEEVSDDDLASAIGAASQAAPGEAGEAPSLDTLAERAAASVSALVAAHKARPAELYKRVTELQAASQAVKAEHGAVSLAFMEAEQAVAKATLEACAAIKEAQRIEVAAQAFLASIKPAETIAAPTRKSTAQRLAEARIALSTAK